MCSPHLLEISLAVRKPFKKGDDLSWTFMIHDHRLQCKMSFLGFDDNQTFQAFAAVYVTVSRHQWPIK